MQNIEQNTTNKPCGSFIKGRMSKEKPNTDFFHHNAIVREKNDVAYKPSTLTYFQRSVQRHLNTKGLTVNLLKEVSFKPS